MSTEDTIRGNPLLAALISSKKVDGTVYSDNSITLDPELLLAKQAGTTSLSELREKVANYIIRYSDMSPSQSLNYLVVFSRIYRTPRLVDLVSTSDNSKRALKVVLSKEAGTSEGDQYSRNKLQDEDHFKAFSLELARHFKSADLEVLSRMTEDEAFLKETVDEWCKETARTLLDTQNDHPVDVSGVSSADMNRFDNSDPKSPISAMVIHGLPASDHEKTTVERVLTLLYGSHIGDPSITDAACYNRSSYIGELVKPNLSMEGEVDISSLEGSVYTLTALQTQLKEAYHDRNPSEQRVPGVMIEFLLQYTKGSQRKDLESTGGDRVRDLLEVYLPGVATISALDENGYPTEVCNTNLQGTLDAQALKSVGAYYHSVIDETVPWLLEEPLTALKSKTATRSTPGDFWEKTVAKAVFLASVTPLERESLWPEGAVESNSLTDPGTFGPGLEVRVHLGILPDSVVEEIAWSDCLEAQE